MRNIETFNQALNYSFLLLKYRARSKKEIIFRLKKRDVSASLIEKVVEYLEQHKYLDDKAFAQSFVEACRAKAWGPRKTACALARFGVAGDLAETILKENDNSREIVKELIEKRKKYYQNKKNPQASLLRYLVGRGFSYQDIMAVMEEDYAAAQHNRSFVDSRQSSVGKKNKKQRLNTND